MSRKARIRAAAAAAVALAIGLLFATGTVQGVFASFSAETENSGSAFAGGWIPAATVGTTSIGGTGNATFTLNWTSAYSGTAGTAGNHIAAQQLERADGGPTTGAASCGTYSNVGASLGQAIATTTSAGGDPAGDWQCFEIVGLGPTATGPWSTPATWAAVRLFVATGLDQHPVTGGGRQTNRIDNADQIILTFNQAATLTGTIRVRVCSGTAATAKILISNAAIGSCTTTPNIGTITGQSQGTNEQCNTSSVGGSGSTTLTITIGGCGSTSATGAGTATFTPAAANAVTGGSVLCTSTSAPNCTSIATTTDRF